MRIFILLFILLQLMGCHESGTWKDDPRNWDRVFEMEKPDDVNVIHSLYWRSAHFTYEYEFYMQIEKNDTFRDRLLSLNTRLVEVKEEDFEDVEVGTNDKPAWFAPKPIEQYRVWIYPGESVPWARMLMDRETGDLYLWDMQL